MNDILAQLAHTNYHTFTVPPIGARLNTGNQFLSPSILSNDKNNIYSLLVSASEAISTTKLNGKLVFMLVLVFDEKSLKK